MSKFLTNTSAKCIFIPQGKRVREVFSLVKRPYYSPLHLVSFTIF